MSSIADRVATRYRVAFRYRIVRAYTHAEALAILGLPAGSVPSDSEINKAYRDKVKEVLKSDPDSALGAQEGLKTLNQAKDTLSGQFVPKGDPDDPTDRRHRTPGAPPPPSYTGEPVDVDFGFPGTNGRPKPDPVRITFEEAFEKAGVQQVDWKFKTQTSYGGYGDTHSSAFVVYGVGEGDTHVFVAAQHYHSKSPFTGHDIDTWWMEQEKTHGEFRTVAPRVIRELYGRFPYELKKGYNARVNILPEGTKFNEQINHLRLEPVAFKDAVVLMGLVGDDDAWKKNQKREIKIQLVYGKLGEPDPVIITVNGREFKLNLEISGNLDKKGVLKKIMGEYPSPGSHKTITKMRGGGKDALKLLAKYVTEPPELKEILEDAANSKAEAA